ncbi:MAG: ATP synthase F1 subunit gamma [Peptococcaceae bacterium]|nr:ATP synthase F1 subunit gamma [Peptococcaceae bacterium]
MQQITRAMKMVAASRLRRAQDKAVASRPYAQQIKAVMGRLLQAQPEDAENALLVKRTDMKKRLFVLMTADRGLCGGYNANLIRTMQAILSKEDSPCALITVGRRGRDYFIRQGTEILAEFTGLGESPTYEQAGAITEELVRLYTEGEVDEVCLVFSRFVSVLTQTPSMTCLLPIELEDETLDSNYGKDHWTNAMLYREGQRERQRASHEESGRTGGKKTGKSVDNYIFEPNPHAILEALLPQYLNKLVYNALLESKASEQGAKMTAMDAATENCKGMIERYTLAMNRARQAAITKEISEIVGGAAALE